jgi:hypothetical protein
LPSGAELIRRLRMADGMNTDPTPIHNKGKIPRVDRAANSRPNMVNFDQTRLG